MTPTPPPTEKTTEKATEKDAPSPAPTDSGRSGDVVGLYVFIVLIVLGMIAAGVSFARL